MDSNRLDCVDCHHRAGCMDQTCEVKLRPRHTILGFAVLALGAGIALTVPGIADTPTDGPVPNPPAELAMVDEAVLTDPPPPEPSTVGGFLSELNLADNGLLTLAGITQLDGSPADLPISIWINNQPAPSVELPAPPTSAASESTTTVAPVEAAEPAPGEFVTSVQLAEGPQEVCAIASNDAGPDALLGCEQVMFRANLVDGKIIVSDYGSGATPRLGIAGEGTPMEAAQRVAERAREWEEKTGIPTIPAFDYIQTVAQASPGSDGDYSAHTSREDLEEYLEAIRSVDGLLILDFQPGGGHFMKQIQQYEEYLREPDVGLALDTEWRMPWGVAPATVIGYANASEINEVGEYLANIVAEDNLPQKPFVIHQFTKRMVRNREDIAVRPELATIFHIDGHGGKTLKKGVYKSLLPREEHYTGFKLFFDEDTGLMTPEEVVNELARIPAMVSYQ